MAVLPKAFPPEFREEVVRVARRREQPLRQTAKDFGISEPCLNRWLSIDEIESGDRVLGFSTQAFYKWRAQPWSDSEWDDAHLLNEIVDLHADDPEFGYRFLHDELVAEVCGVGANRVHRLCRQNHVWSVFAKKRGHGRKVGPPVHDDLVKRHFKAEQPDQVWLTDITEHWTDEGKLYMCAFNDVCSGRTPTGDRNFVLEPSSNGSSITR